MREKEDQSPGVFEDRSRYGYRELGLGESKGWEGAQGKDPGESQTDEESLGH